ncbi:MAG: ribonuclease J [Patescibacteria group bacterium]
MTSQETNNAPAENTQPTEKTQSEPRTPRARPPRSKPESGSRAPRPPRERGGYFAGKDPKPNAGPDKLEPGASFITIPKFRNKRSFPFVTPQQALKKHLGYEELRVTPTPKDVLRVIPFGGVEQVGLNCTGFEYNGEVLIIDMGLQFADQYQHGISCSIPDLSYVKGKKVAGIVITHGHIDHIGAVPYAVKQLGKNVPTYATSMAYELIAMKQAENNATMTNLERINRNVPIQVGENFQIMPFTVDHSIPDSVGILIETPVGRFVHTGDWKFDKTPLPYRPSTDYSLLDSIGNRGVRALLSDSTNAHLMGSSISESEVVRSIEEIFEKSEGRVITATFSSIIDRVMIIISAAEKYNRKVVLLGRGMNNYMDIAFKLGYARPKPGTLISMEEANRLPDSEVTICCTGAQGERYAALMRIATGESKDTELRATDIVVFSSSVIPGNERAVQGLFDIILTQGPRIYQYKESEIHAGGHARAEDTKKMIGHIRPEVFMPVYGYPHMLHGNARNAYEMGYSKDRVLITRNGQVVEFTKDDYKLTDMYVPHRLLTVDGYMVGITKEPELHDREQLKAGGVIAVSIAKKPGDFLFKLDTAGFPGFHNFPRLEDRIIDFLDNTLKNEIQRFPNADAFKTHASKKVADIIFEETGKEPMVLVLVH